MNFIESIIRILLVCVILFFAVLKWAVIPYLGDLKNIDTSIMSIFLGNREASAWTLKFLLLSRAALGLSIALYVLMPVYSIFSDTDISHIRHDICLLLVGVSVCAWIGSLIYHFMFVI